MGLATLDDVKRQLFTGGVAADTVDDAWLALTIAAVSEAIESPAVTGRWFRSRGTQTYLFDSEQVTDQRRLKLPMGITSLSYLGVAFSDQPDDGSGTYTQVTQGVYLNPPAQSRIPGDPAFELVLGISANIYLPFAYPARRCVKVTGSWGYAAVPERVRQIATSAVVRAYKARLDGGSADLAVTGMDGGMRVLRDLAPAELEWLRATYRVPVAA